VELPPAVPVSDEAVSAIADRHGLGVSRGRILASSGIINTVVALDDRFALRVPRDHPGHVDQARIEAEAIPLAVAAGVRTPDLVAFDDTLEILPVPYLVVDLVAGRDVESVAGDPADLTELWFEVGRDLGRLHTGVDPALWPGAPPEEAATSNLIPWPPHDPEALVRQRVDQGWLSYLEGRWLLGWIGRLDDGRGGPVPVTATHGDVQMSNILMDETSGRYRALLDWGCAATKDAVVDFMPIPLAVVPHLLAGHRDVAPLADDDRAELRILRGRIHAVLAMLPRGAAPGTTWGERPVAWLTDLLRFFVEPPNDRWRALAPPTPRT
jgi:Ser/Thr protein kinase RdoA (MazF antagonist)